MKRSNWLAPTLVIVGLLLIFVSTWAPQSKIQFSFSKKKIARVTEKTGTVKFQNSDIPSPVDVELNQILELRNQIRTDADSESVIEFNNGGQFRISEKSEVLIDILDTGASLVVIKSGEITIEKFGKSPSFWVRQNGQLYNAVDYALIDKRKSSNIKEIVANQTSEQLSQIEIENTLNSKKNDFFKCYGQLIQKNPQATGQVLISFTIENHGNTEKVEISKSEIADLNFKNCLQEVVARAQFRAFSGNSITTVFPLKFE